MREVRNVAQDGVVQIHGRQYVTVAKRVELGHEDQAIESIETEVLLHDPVVVRAKVTIKGKLFTGISSVSLTSGKLIEQQNPYEVAETSAVGRALGFAGYGVVDSIASADEIQKSQASVCKICGQPVTVKTGTTKTGKPYTLVACTSGNKAHNQWLWK